MGWRTFMNEAIGDLTGGIIDSPFDEASENPIKPQQPTGCSETKSAFASNLEDSKRDQQ